MNLLGKKKLQQDGTDLILETSLQTFFFDHLNDLNQKSTRPLPNEAIYYSSLLLDKFGESQNYFEVEEGRIKEKILGLKLLESNSLNKNSQKRALMDIGDTALFLCGYFAESLNRKIVDGRYYQNIGIMAYDRLNHLEPDFLDFPEFYSFLSRSFETLTMMIGTVAQSLSAKSNEVSLFISTPHTIKVS